MIPVVVTRAVRAYWPEWRAAFAWIVASWLRPADADAAWEQGADQRPRRSRR